MQPWERPRVIAGGGYHSLALKADGSIVSWGYDPFGQVSDTPAGNDFVQVAAGQFHSLALKADGSIVSWGYDNNGQVSDTPAGNDFVQVAAGQFHSLALKADGSIVSWGSSGGAAPIGNDFVQVAAGAYFSVALKADGSIVSWGRDDYGQVSDTPAGNDFVQVAASSASALALKADGSIVSWGRDDYGQVSDTPAGNDFVQVAVGQFHSLALKADGSIVSWGSDTFGQVSDTPTGNDFWRFENVITGSMDIRAIANIGIKAIGAAGASIDLKGLANITADAEIGASDFIVGAANLTGKVISDIRPYIIANAWVDIRTETIPSIRPYIIANAATDILGSAILDVGALRLIILTGDYEITADDYFTKDQPANSFNVANYIIVETQPLRPAEELEEIYRSNETATIEAGETQTITIFYQEKPVIDALIKLEGNLPDTSITNVNYYAWGANVTIKNRGSSADEYIIIATGRPLRVQGSERVVAKHDRSILENGKIEYELPKNHLIQTKEMAQLIANRLKDSFADPQRDIVLNWRGNPALVLADPIKVPEFKNQMAKFYVTRQELNYDGGLTASLEGRKVE